MSIFKNNVCLILQQLVEARASRIITSEVDEESDILKIALSQNILPDAPAYTRQRSNSKCIPCDWKLKDNFLSESRKNNNAHNRRLTEEENPYSFQKNLAIIT